MSDLLRRNFPDYAASKEIVPAATEDNDYPLMVREDRILRLPKDVLLRPGETDRITINGTECALGGNYTIGTLILDATTDIDLLEVPDACQELWVRGFSSVGDGGGLTWLRRNTEPTHAAKRQSANGVWFEASSDFPIYPEMLGAVGDWTLADGGTDDGAALQAMLDLPLRYETRLRRKAYYTSSGLSVPNGRHLYGYGITFERFDVFDPTYFSGSLIVSDLAAALDGDGEPTNAVLDLERDSGLHGVAVYWDGQPAPGTGWTPVKTPWAVRCGSFAENLRPVRDEGSGGEIQFFAVSHGVLLERGSEGGRWRRIQGQAFMCGLRMDGVHDITYFDFIHFFPYWSINDYVMDYTRNNYVATDIGRIDGWNVSGGLFSYGAAIGLQFRGSKSPDFPGQPANHISIRDFYSDSCKRGIVGIAASNPLPALTGSIDKCVISRTSDAEVPGGADDWGIDLDIRHDFTIGILEGTGAGYSRKGSHVRVTANNSTLRIVVPRLCQYDTDDLGKAAIYCPNHTSRIILGTPVELYQGGDLLWFASDKPLLVGDPARGHANIQTPYSYYIDGISTNSNRSFGCDGTNKGILNVIGKRPLAEGAREVRVIARVASHTAPTTFSMRAENNGAVYGHEFTTTGGTGAAEDFDSGWKTISFPSPRTDSDLGTIFWNGDTGGESSLLVTRLAMMFR